MLLWLVINNIALKIPLLDTAQVYVINKGFPYDILSQELIVM